MKNSNSLKCKNKKLTWRKNENSHKSLHERIKPRKVSDMKSNKMIPPTKKSWKCPSCTHHTVLECCYGSAPWPDWPPRPMMGWGKHMSGCPVGGWTRHTQWSGISSLPPHMAAGWSHCSVWPARRQLLRIRSACGTQGVSTQTWLYLHHCRGGTDTKCGYIALIL